MSHSTNIPAKVDSLKARQAWLDGKGVDGVMPPEELDELCETSNAIHSLSRVNTSFCWQQSRLLWLE